MAKALTLIMLVLAVHVTAGADERLTYQTMRDGLQIAIEQSVCSYANRPMTTAREVCHGIRRALEAPVCSYAGDKPTLISELCHGIQLAKSGRSCGYVGQTGLYIDVCDGIRLAGSGRPCGYSNRPMTKAGEICSAIRAVGTRILF